MSERPRILVVDDEQEVGTFFRHLFKSQYDVTMVCSARDAEKAVSADFFDTAFVDLKLSDGNGLSVLKTINAKIPHCSVIIMTGYSTVGTAVQAIQQGAFNYIEKPFDDLNYLRKLVTDALGANDGLSTAQSVEEGFVIGTNPRMRSVVSLARKVADKKLTVLIEGETGTGKEVLARFIHRYSDRAAHPFLAVNCGAFSETLLESELFGHEKGSFTGASSARRGIFEMAHKGTLFLDEIAEASMATQVKLLRMLENDEILRVGGEHPFKCDVRLIAATSMDIEESVKQGRFREDLFYRLNVINLKLPPLRERREDIGQIIKYVVKEKLHKFNTAFSQEAVDLLTSYNWPGNVRELINVVTQILAICDEKEITPLNLPLKITAGDRHWEEGRANVFADKMETLLAGRDLENGVNLRELIKEMKSVQNDIIKNIINRILQSYGGNQCRAAESLHITPRQLQYYLNEK
ncbi:MAG: sigma-54 dependent transcriptional regulator [Syntrophomonas sp.]